MLSFSIEEIEVAIINDTGFCVNCRSEQDSCEPDARQRTCDQCGEKAVYGAEELIFMGLVH